MEKKMVKIHILKHIASPAGVFEAGQEVEVDEELASQLADGVKAQKLEDWQKSDAAKKDPSKMTVAQMQKAGVKNVVSPDAAIYAQAEQAALNGAPIASGEPLTVTGGVTPPTMVFPAMAEAAGHDVTEVKDVKGLKDKKEDKSLLQKAGDMVKK